jgi:nucleoporin POM34
VSVTGSPFSPGASPFVQKAMGGSNGSNRRHSYGSSSLGPGSSRMGGLDTPGTPTPGATKGGGIGLNSKWLYDKGRRNSGSAKLYT